MPRVVAIACVILSVAVVALAFAVHDAQSRIDALEKVVAARPASAPSASLATHASSVDDDASDTLRPARSWPAAPLAHASSSAADAPSTSASGAAAQHAGEKALEQRVPDLVRGELQRIDDERREERDERQRQRITRQLDKLQNDVALTADQRGKLQDMLDAESVEIRQLMSDARDSGDFSGVRDKIAAVRAQTDANANAVLDDDKQKPAYQQMRSDERQRFAGAGAGANGGAGRQR